VLGREDRSRRDGLLARRPGRMCRRRDAQMHLSVDAIVALPPDRDLQLVARRRQVQRAARAYERSSQRECEVPLEPRRLNLRLPAKSASRPCLRPRPRR
jgi:hypothetical protein